MTHVPHQLAEEFPDQADRIRDLKQNDPHFAVVAAKYEEANHQVHLAETNVKPLDDVEMLNLRKERMVLKDEVAALLTAAAAS